MTRPGAKLAAETEESSETSGGVAKVSAGANSVRLKTGLTVTPPPSRGRYQRPKNVWPASAGSSGKGTLMEAWRCASPKPAVAATPRNSAPVAGMLGPGPGSRLSMTRIASPPPGAFETATVKLGLPISGGSITVTSMLEPSDSATGTRADSV